MKLCQGVIKRFVTKRSKSCLFNGWSSGETEAARGSPVIGASFQRNFVPTKGGAYPVPSYHPVVSPERGGHRCFCWPECSSRLAMCQPSRLQNAMKQNPDISAKSKLSPEVHDVLLTLTRASGSISPPRAAPVASNPLSCEIVCDRPDPEAPVFSSWRSPGAAVWAAAHTPEAGAAPLRLRMCSMGS